MTDKVEIKCYDQSGKLKSHNMITPIVYKNGALNTELTMSIKAALIQDWCIVIGRLSFKIAGYSCLNNKLCDKSLPDDLIKLYKEGGEVNMSFWKNLRIGLALYAILMEMMPMILLDGKITVDEMSELIKKLCEAVGFRTEIAVPDELKAVDIGIVSKD